MSVMMKSNGTLVTRSERSERGIFADVNYGRPRKLVDSDDERITMHRLVTGVAMEMSFAPVVFARYSRTCAGLRVLCYSKPA
jgi:hypothetical protein